MPNKKTTPEWWQKLRQNPALIIAVAGVFGVSGGEITIGAGLCVAWEPVVDAE